MNLLKNNDDYSLKHLFWLKFLMNFICFLIKNLFLGHVTNRFVLKIKQLKLIQFFTSYLLNKKLFFFNKMSNKIFNVIKWSRCFVFLLFISKLSDDNTTQKSIYLKNDNNNNSFYIFKYQYLKLFCFFIKFLEINSNNKRRFLC